MTSSGGKLYKYLLDYVILVGKYCDADECGKAQRFIIYCALFRIRSIQS